MSGKPLRPTRQGQAKTITPISTIMRFRPPWKKSSRSSVITLYPLLIGYVQVYMEYLKLTSPTLHFLKIELLAILIKPLVGVTLVSSSEGYPCGVEADQLNLGSAIPPMQMPVPPLQPGGTVILPDDGSDLRLGLGTGIMQVPGPSTGLLDWSAATSEQAQLEQQIQLQQIRLQREQLQGVHPDLVLPGGTMAYPRVGSQPRGATARAAITGVTELAPSSQQHQEQQHHHHRYRLPDLGVAPLLHSHSPQPIHLRWARP